MTHKHVSRRAFVAASIFFYVIVVSLLLLLLGGCESTSERQIDMETLQRAIAAQQEQVKSVQTEITQGGPSEKQRIKQDGNYNASTWATPELNVDGEVMDCYKMQSETPGWDGDTYWPEEARKELGV